MEKLKKRWDIVENWQLLFPFLGMTLTICSAYLFARRLLHLFELNNTPFEWALTIVFTSIFSIILFRFFIWCFKKLEGKWPVTYRWEMIAIFIVFAVTGSTAAKLAAPVTELIGLDRETTNTWLFWTIRILIIFPLYQVLLVVFGWLFGQFRFFWSFEKKMINRLGLGFLLK